MENQIKFEIFRWMSFKQDGHHISVNGSEIFQLTFENDWSQNFYIKDFNDLSGRKVLHLVDVETGEESLMWADRITHIEKIGDDAS